jgi:hypothetical protein
MVFEITKIDNNNITLSRTIRLEIIPSFFVVFIKLILRVNIYVVYYDPTVKVNERLFAFSSFA